jgi:D-tyrosyl-tRNA(Tyr) deacylase
LRIVAQKVKNAKVEVAGKITGEIDKGIMILLGIEHDDSEEDADWLINKVSKLRIFKDKTGVMNFSIKDVEGDFLVVSQFTLHANTKKGTRPSYIRSAKPDVSLPLFEKILAVFESLCESKVATGKFGAHMDVHLVNDGPVTIWLDSKNKSY